MNLKKYRSSFFACILLSSSAVMAMESYENVLCGFYAGASAGESLTSSNATVSSHRSVSAPREAIGIIFENDIFAKHVKRKNKLAATLYSGYGYAWQDLYLGAEAFLNFSHYKTKGSKSTVNRLRVFDTGVEAENISVNNGMLVKTKLRGFEPGIDLRPGIFLSPCTLLFARVGIAYNKISFTSVMNDIAIINAAGLERNLNSSVAMQKNRKTLATRLGLGLEQNICDNVTIRADYIHTHYRRLKANQRQAVSNTGGDILTQNTTVVLKSFSRNAVMLGVSYYW